jgi:hypothetical protein
MMNTALQNHPRPIQNWKEFEADAHRQIIKMFEGAKLEDPKAKAMLEELEAAENEPN